MPYFINKKKERIRYKSIKGKSPGIIFIHGLNSDMSGQKALSIERFARKNKLKFIRFECRGHGKSDGNFEDFTISDWKKDLLDIIDNIAKGPQILVGSSMGGWLMFLAAKVRPSKIIGMVGLAAAPDYIDEFYKNLPLVKKKEIREKGIMKYSSYGFSYLIKKKYIVDGKKNKILNKEFKWNKPLILIQGLRDNVVKSDVPEKIIKKIKGNQIQIKLLKNSDHRLSEPFDLKIINEAIKSAINKS
ncbi:MAG: hypothetical protein CBD97_01900 [Pelagibacteraceae bacterium TMED237]|nr:MAG: hypothetical protein CBD97_01900 [Pelagibacteraceae bacterium TMED237]|tara:strand:- start:1686 stop:2420 length:735 start_codon:yes stop_codon:yes gene_type:complete